MTTIDFYTHCNEPFKVTVQLVNKAWSQHGSVRIVTADAAMTEALDGYLWSWPATGFLPHCRLNSPLAAETPILLDHVLEHQGAAGVLVNLHTATPPFFARFERLVEIVSDREEDVAAARERWRFYKDRGYDLRSHKLADRA